MKFTATTIIALVIGLMCHSQLYNSPDTTTVSPVASRATTEIEYNYIKKGLQTSFDQGLDIKKGYYLQDVTDNLQYGNAWITAKRLLRSKDNSIAGTWIKIVVKGTFSGDGAYVYCIPAPNFEYQESYGWTQLMNEVSGANMESAKKALMWWLLYQYSLQSDRANQLQKKVKTN
jgi:hypothetical protein